MLNSPTWPIDRTLSDATTSGQVRPGSEGNEGVLRIPQSSSITCASPSDCLALYPGYLLKESNLSAAADDWAKYIRVLIFINKVIFWGDWLL